MAQTWPPKRAASFDLYFTIRDADGDPVSGAAGLDSEVAKDGGAFTDCTNEAAEIGSSGVYKLTLTASEMTADAVVAITKTTTTDAKTAVSVLYTVAATWDERLDAAVTSRQPSGNVTVGAYAAGQSPPDLLLVTPANKLNVDAANRAKVDVERWLAATPNALVSGRVDASVGALAAAVITSAALATDAIGAAGLAADAVNEIRDAVWAAASRTLTAFGFSVTVGTNNDKTGYALTVAEKDDVVDRVWDEDVDASHQTAGSAGKKLDDAGGASSPSAIADAVWDEALSGHQAAGSAGKRLDEAGSAGDPWGTLLPGAYGAGTAGQILGSRLDVAVSTRVTGGAGALTRTIGLTAGGNPLEGASLWLATDAAGANVVAGPLVTDSQGEPTVLLDAGSFYVWVQKDGFTSIIGQPVSLS